MNLVSKWRKVADHCLRDSLRSAPREQVSHHHQQGVSCVVLDLTIPVSFSKLRFNSRESIFPRNRLVPLKLAMVLKAFRNYSQIIYHNTTSFLGPGLVFVAVHPVNHLASHYAIVVAKRKSSVVAIEL